MGKTLLKYNQKKEEGIIGIYISYLELMKMYH